MPLNSLRINNDLREFVESLNSNKVDYLVVGPFAVASYGYVPFTGAGIGRAALIRSKESTARAKDLGDAEELRERQSES